MFDCQLKPEHKSPATRASRYTIIINQKEDKEQKYQTEIQNLKITNKHLHDKVEELELLLQQ